MCIRDSFGSDSRSQHRIYEGIGNFWKGFVSDNIWDCCSNIRSCELQQQRLTGYLRLMATKQGKLVGQQIMSQEAGVNKRTLVGVGSYLEVRISIVGDTFPRQNLSLKA